MMRASWSLANSSTKAKSFTRPLRAKRSFRGKSISVCTTDADCCAIVIEYMYGGVIFVVQNHIVVWHGCGVGSVFGKKQGWHQVFFYNRVFMVSY